MSIELALPAARQRPLMRALAWLASWRGVLVWAVASRIVVFVGALVVHLVRPHGYFPASTYGSLQNVLGAWDGRWYRMVAAQGYSLVPGHKSDVAFFPLSALVLRGMHALAVGGFLVYLAVAFDNIRAWSTAEAAWGRSFRLGGILDAFAQLPADIRGHPWLVRDLGFLVAYVLLLAVAVRLRIGAAWIAAA